MRVHVTDLRPGDRLVSDAFNSQGLHILSAEAVLEGEEISKLFHHDIDYVDIALRQDSVLEAPRPDDKPVVSAAVVKVYNDAVDAVRTLFGNAAATGNIDDDEANRHFDPLTENISKQTDMVALLLSLNHKDDYTYQHCVQVGMIAYFLSKWLGNSEQDAQLAGKAGYLHDIGKSMVPDSILKKPAKLSDEEYNEMKKHTVNGFEILSRSLKPEEHMLALAALQHHERYDGKGYPSGIKAESMHPLSKIIAVSDIYSAMISSRVYQKQRDLLFVLKELHRISFSEVDPLITQVFIKNMLPHLIGKKVLLNNGEVGSIIMTNQQDYFRPLIRVDNRFIDLMQEPSLLIEKITV